MSEERVITLEHALERETALACPVLEQRVWRLRAGEVLRERLHGQLFAFSGGGTLRLDGAEHRFATETGAVATGELELEAEDDLVVVAVATPRGEPAGERVVRFDDVEPESAGIGRYFRMLAQSTAATQFVGLVPPGRANMHNHPYDELACVVEGDGVLHWHEGPSIPVGRGSLIYFPRLAFHSLENTGGEMLRIMGVFHPAGSPADRVEVLDY